MNALLLAACGAALASAAAWALGSILFRKLGDHVSPVAMNLGKDLVGLPLLGVALLLAGPAAMDLRAIVLLSLSGLIGIALGDTLFFMALVRLEPRRTLLLATIGQVFTVLLAVGLLGERPTPSAWGGICLVLFGVSWVMRESADELDSEGQSSRRWGILCGLGAALCFAAATILAKVGVASVSALQGTFVRLAAGVVGLVAWGIVRGQVRGWLQPLRETSLLRKLVVAEMVIVFGGFWLGLWSLKHLDASLATVLASTEPLFVLPLGLWMLHQKPTLRGVLGAVVAVVGVGLIIASLGGEPSPGSDVGPPSAERVRSTIEVEQLIAQLGPLLTPLADDLRDGALPGEASRSLFASVVDVSDLAGEGERDLAAQAIPFGAVRRWTAPGPSRSMTRDELGLLVAPRRGLASIEHARLAIARGEGGPDGRFHTEVELHLQGRGERGVIGLGARIELVWETVGDEWQIRRWTSRSARVTEAPARFFHSDLARAVPDDALRDRLRRSEHEERLRAWIVGPDDEWPHRWFSPESIDRHPALSVVDIDAAGHDDLYVMARWGPNILLHNQGDGTFEDAAPPLGLDVVDHCSSALFVDLDNDGDKDLLLGRTLAPSLYLRNEGGHFVDRTEQLVPGGLPPLVSSISAADYNQDGLLDVYVATYGANSMEMEMESWDEAEEQGEHPPLLSEFLPPDEARELGRRFVEELLFTDRAGPVNHLLVNRGDGRLEPAPESGQLAVWRNSFQATWADFDQDGRPDLYVANDFAPNQLFRNLGATGAGGSPGFADVTDETGTVDVGFGMGASWGDVDGDGDLDLYVSNMFSKAGRRITSALDGLTDRQLPKMAQGNTLFRNQGGRFEAVSGLEPPAVLVERAGWSWGSQFFDADNDGDLDIYAPAGYYTAPVELAASGDL